MKKYLIGALAAVLCATTVLASGTRILPVDSFVSADLTKSWALPSYSGTLIGANSAGNVGVGTTNPLVKLSVVGDITATGTITGTFSGTVTNATNSANVATTAVSTNASFFPLFVASSSNSNQASSLNTSLSFNPSTGTLTTTVFSGSGASLTSLNGSNISSGTVADARLPSSMATKTFTGTTSFPGTSSIDGSGNAVFGGSVTSATDIGGTTASSSKTIESTSGSGTTDFIAFLTASQSERMRINSAGNVGIGTTNPVSIIEASGGTVTDTSYGSAPSFTLRRALGTVGSPTQVTSGSSMGTVITRPYFSDTSAFATSANASISFVAAENITSTAAGSHITFSTVGIGTTTNTENMRLTSAGNLGIGTANPIAKLDVAGKVRIGTTAAYGQINVARASDSTATDMFIQGTGDTTTDFSFVNTSGSASKIALGNGNIKFYTNDNTAQRMVINSSGNVGIGTTNPVAALAVVGLTTGTNADFLCLKADGSFLIQTSACTISSRRFKENINYLDDHSGLEEVMQLRPVEFQMKQTVPPNADINATRLQTGLIAEEVEEVDPRLAIYEDDGVTPKSYRQEAVISVLIKAVQEQQKEIADLRAELHHGGGR